MTTQRTPLALTRGLVLLALFALLGLPAQAQRDIDFLAAADCQFNNHRENGQLAEPDRWDNTFGTMRHLADRIAGEPNLRGLLVPGDMTQNGRGEEFEQYYNALGNQTAKVYDGLGNHDYTGNHAGTCQGNSPPYWNGSTLTRNCDVTGQLKEDWIPRNRATSLYRVADRPHYSWDWEDVHFVQLNLFAGNDPDGPPGYELLNPYAALDFLVQDLAANVGNSGRPVVLMHHYGLESFSQAWWDDYQRDAYWAAIAPYNVVAAITGHLHTVNLFQDWRGGGPFAGSNRTITSFIVGGAWNGDGGSNGQYAEVNIDGDTMVLRRKSRDGSQLQSRTVTFESRVLRVTNGNDSGTGSLRWALEGANSRSGHAAIEFEVPTGFAYLSPTGQLPALTTPVTIRGFSQPSSQACDAWGNVAIKTQLDGYRAGGASGLYFGPGSEGSVVSGLAVVNFSGAGIAIAADDVTVACNNIGLDYNGYVYPNSVGVTVNGSRTVIGGPTALDRNAISGNTFAGIALESGNYSSIASNWIGLGRDRSNKGNGGDGILVASTSNGNLIGTVSGSVANAGNVIAFNDGFGIAVNGADDTSIRYNSIGVTGAGPGGNALHGVLVHGGSVRTLVGQGGAGNTISANGLWGVVVGGEGTDRTHIAGNFIGLSDDGVTDRGNGEAGVLVYDGATNTIIGTNLDGSNDAAEGNTIAANDREGNTIGVQNANVQVMDATTTGTIIRGNRIGTQANGNALPGGGGATGGVRGVFVTAPGVIIGGPQFAAPNIIAGHLHTGIDTRGPSLTVQGNYIGLGADGTTALGNGTGIRLASDSNLIGGAAAAERNLISGNTSIGVLIEAGLFNTVGWNWIGMGADGSDKGNGSDGIRVQGSGGSSSIGRCCYGTTTAPAPNVIAYNDGVGILLDGSSNNLVVHNYVGVGAGNALHGVQMMNGAQNNILGLPDQGNTIAGNGLWGVIIEGAGTTGNTLQGNRIGTAPDGTSLDGNGRDGVLIFNDADGNTVGGTAESEGNTIAGNAESGVQVSGTTLTANLVVGNAMFSNAGLGIDLQGDGFTPNDLDDSDYGANALQNFPEVSEANLAGSALTLSYRVPSSPIHTFYPLRVDVYLADADRQEGERWVATDTYTVADYDACGSPPCDKTVTVSVAGLTGTEDVVATATTDRGGTSEFSPAVGLSTGPLVTFTLTPTNPAPPVVVQRGQRFRFDATTTVAEGGPTSLQYWSEAVFPNGRRFLVLGPITVQLTPGTTGSRNLGQRVDPRNPYGQTWYVMKNGTFPNEVVSADSFAITVVPPALAATGEGGSPAARGVAPGALGAAGAATLGAAEAPALSPAEVAALAAAPEMWLAYDADGSLLEAGAVLDLRVEVAEAADETAETAGAETEAVASEALPEAFALAAAYPNPFADRATLAFELPEAATVRLVVYDVLGRTMAVLADEAFKAGRHTASLEGRDLPSGTYLVRMTTDGGFSATQRLTRLR